MLTFALSAGVVLSIVCQELVGFVPGGIIVPGYVALILDRPASVLSLLAATLATVATIRVLSPHLSLFGSRRFAVAVLVGLALSSVGEWAFVRWGLGPLQWSALGYVVPGLLAHQCDKQGIARTLALTALCAGIVRMAMLVVFRA